MKKSSSKILLTVGLFVLVSLSCSMLSYLPGGGTNGALLKDDFSDSNSGWGTGTDANSSIEYSDGGLQMQIFKKNFFIWSTPNKESYDKVHMEVAVSNNGTDATTAFGLLCYQQTINSSFYYFAITPAGEYAIAKAAVAVSDVFLTNNDQWAKSDLIAKNAASYQVGADCGNGALTLYVDGKQVASVSDSMYTAGSVGVFTWSGEDVSSANVTFDDFVMTKPGQ